MIGYTHDDHVDGADTAAWFLHNVVEADDAFSATTLFEREGLATSQQPSDLPLTQDNVVAQWAKGYGLVFWLGHGLPRHVSRVFWSADDNGNGLADKSEIHSATLIHSDDAERVASGRPAFVVAVSCEIGSVETPRSLAESLLIEGAAIGVVGSTSVTPGSGTDFADFSAGLVTTRSGADNIGVRFFEAVMQGEYAGKAFFDAKVALGSPETIESLAGRTMLNYIGDPSLTLYDTVEDVVQPEPGPEASDSAPQSPGEPDDEVASEGCTAAAPAPGWGLVLLLLLFASRAAARRSRCRG